MKIAVIADDNTGATDAAGMFTSFGARAVLLMSPEQLSTRSRLESFDVLVIGTRIRSVPPEEARNKTAEVTSLLRKRGFDMVQLKYCSTFDSTRDGNIGPSLDAAREVLGFPSAPVCPALPINGRTTYMGYHFVGRELLSESPLSRHPLNPMTDSNLPRWLGYQSSVPVGLVDHRVVRRGAEAIRRHRKELEAGGVVYHVTDALTRGDIDSILAAYEDTGFVSGGSGISEAMGKRYFSEFPRLDFSSRLEQLEKRIVIISGSRSPATRRQEETALSAGFKALRVHPLMILRDEVDHVGAAEQAYTLFCDSDVPGIILGTEENDGGDVRSVHRTAEVLGMSPVEAGKKISDCLGRIAAELILKRKVDRLLVAGGETSGAVCFEAGLEALEVGRQIDPGVPYCFPVERDGPMVILKSGNFGEDDLFVRAGVIKT